MADSTTATDQRVTGRDRQVLIAGLVRNGGTKIKADVHRMRNALRSFPNLHWLVVESDSDDDTVQRLTELSTEIANFRFLSLGTLRRDMPIRTVRLAHCRNTYLDEFRANPAYRHIDTLIVADLDGLNDLIGEQALLSCWERDDWDVCTANQRGPYYDMWTLRHPVWCPGDCWEQYRFLAGAGVSTNKALFAAVYAKMIRVPEDSPWIEVDSAFGGLALYKRRALDGVGYAGVTPAGVEVCEHVILSQGIRAAGHRIFINPRLINAAFTEHTRHLGPYPAARLRWALRCLARALRDLGGRSRPRLVFGAMTDV
jgi:hypothetical protein